MNEPVLKFETQLPGEEIPKHEASPLVEAFLDRFRKCKAPETPSNVPTACTLRGRKDREYLNKPQFLDRKSILFYLEAAQILRRTTPTAVADYFATREPWEDYDVCLFDESLKWCVGITHNDDVIVID